MSIGHPSHKDSQHHKIKHIEQRLIDSSVVLRINRCDIDFSFLRVLFPLENDELLVPWFNNIF